MDWHGRWDRSSNRSLGCTSRPHKTFRRRHCVAARATVTRARAGLPGFRHWVRGTGQALLEVRSSVGWLDARCSDAMDRRSVLRGKASRRQVHATSLPPSACQGTVPAQAAACMQAVTRNSPSSRFLCKIMLGRSHSLAKCATKSIVRCGGCMAAARINFRKRPQETAHAHRCHHRSPASPGATVAAECRRRTSARRLCHRAGANGSKPTRPRCPPRRKPSRSRGWSNRPSC